MCMLFSSVFRSFEFLPSVETTSYRLSVFVFSSPRFLLAFPLFMLRLGFVNAVISCGILSCKVGLTIPHLGFLLSKRCVKTF